MARRSIADCAVPLSKAALLISLEEEAAAALLPPAADPQGEPVRTSGGAATWSLSRLDALADDALAHFRALHGDGGAAGGGGAAGVGGAAAGGPGARLAAWVQRGLAALNHALSSSSGDTSSGPGGPPADGPAGGDRAALLRLVREYPVAALGSVNAVVFDRQGYAACNRWGEAR